MKKLEMVKSLAPDSDEEYFESPDCTGVRMRFRKEEPSEGLVRIHLAKDVIRERLDDDFEVPYVALDVSLDVLDELVKAAKKQRNQISK